jgi:hypothetical protein
MIHPAKDESIEDPDLLASEMMSFFVYDYLTIDDGEEEADKRQAVKEAPGSQAKLHDNAYIEISEEGEHDKTVEDEYTLIDDLISDRWAHPPSCGQLFG